MKEEIIKDILSKDQKKILSKDFNVKIIQQLNLSKKKEKQMLFDEKYIVKIFMVVFLFILGANLNIIEKLTQTDMIIGAFICIIPLFFMVFNKIYQLKIQNSQSNENLI